MYKNSLNTDIAINALLYICNRISDEDGRVDKYKLLKILYFAEKKHLSKYGRLITDDDFVAMEHGPVPSYCYDVTKTSQNEGYFKILNQSTLIPLKQVDLDELSESEIECLEEAIEENKDLSFKQLKAKSHDEAYNNTGRNRCIDFDLIVKASGAGENLQDYIRLYYSNKLSAR